MLLNRRSALSLIACLTALGAVRPASAAARVITYSEQTLAEVVASGEPYLIDFFATWCGTCAAQDRVLEGLAAESTIYAAIPIIRVDWDEHSRGDLVRKMGIPRRSTLVMMRGTTELGRLVADTRRDAIAGLLDLSGS
jgi:thiol-disulfide isomerase/thioredoxin